jgi:flagellar hook assembly protein FlgD
MNGELVKICLEGKQSSGYHNIQWDGRDENGNSVPAGVYLYRLKSDGFSQSNKMILIR